MSCIWKMSKSVALGISLVIHAGSVHAAPVTIVNSGFEDISGESQNNEFTFGPLNGWDLYDPNGITAGGAGGTYFIGTLAPDPPTNFTSGAAEGQRVGIAFNFAGSGGQGEYGMQQTLSDTLQANSSYSLQVEIGNIASGTAQNNQFFDLEGFPGYRIDLLAGGVVLTQDNNSLSGLIAEGEFGTSTIAFNTGNTHAQLGQPLQIRLVNLNQVDPLFPAANLEVDFDDVRLDVTSVPEPSTLMGIGMFSLLIVRRRKS
ncbi:MAG: PEP-CTERM sorting domain-containing protein [Rubripirellula sp.]